MTRMKYLVSVSACAALLNSGHADLAGQQLGCGSGQCAEFVNPTKEDVYVQVLLGGSIANNEAVGRCSSYNNIKNMHLKPGETAAIWVGDFTQELRVFDYPSGTTGDCIRKVVGSSTNITPAQHQQIEACENAAKRWVVVTPSINPGCFCAVKEGGRAQLDLCGSPTGYAMPQWSIQRRNVMGAPQGRVGPTLSRGR